MQSSAAARQRRLPRLRYRSENKITSSGQPCMLTLAFLPLKRYQLLLLQDVQFDTIEMQ